MKPALIVLSVALVLTAGAAFAQQTPPSPAEHNAHHPQGAQSAPTPPPARPPATGQAAAQPGQSSPGMMGCPMMQGMGGGMMGGGGMHAMMHGAPQMGGSAQRSDETVPSLAFKAANDKMHRDMAITYTGNVDADFAKAMIAHHQGAVDMAKITVAFGKDEQIRKLAEDIVKAQEVEIATLKDWLAKTAR
jgi:hypothetical protein